LKELMSRIYVAVDLETTGLYPDRDVILEIGAVKFRVPPVPGSDPIIDRWSTLVNPGRSIPYRITRLTGITQQEVERAPPLTDGLQHLRRFVGNYPVIGHNVRFELAFLQRHGLLVGQAHLDTFELASILLPDAPRYSLEKLATYLELDFEGWHRALADAEMAARLFIALWQEACNLPSKIREEIVAVALDSPWPLRSFFAAAHRSAPASRDEPAHPRASLPLVAPPSLNRAPDPEPLPIAELERFLSQNGPLAAYMPGFEERPEQIAMLNAVTRAFAEESHLIVEAGTGTGKSLAYLVAAIYQATTRQEPVVVSTNTLNLQDQLFYNDIPLLAPTIDRPFSALRLKGRTNYVCARRVTLLQQRGAFSEAEARLLARVLVWLQRTESGDREELNLQQDEEPLWELICADSRSCTPQRCAPYGTCYWLDVHARAASAHLLVVNHALLVADLAAGGGLIPPYRDVIVDEAHHLEDQATQQYGFVLQQEHLHAILEQLGVERGGRDVGLLARIRHQARNTERDGLASLIDRSGLLLRQVNQCIERADELVAALHEILRHQPRQEKRFRILPEWRSRRGWGRLEQAVESYCEDLQQLADGLRAIDHDLGRLAIADGEWQELSASTSRALLALDTLCHETERILLHPDANDVPWIMVRTAESADDEERNEDGVQFHVTLHRSPLTVAPLLKYQLFDQKRTVVLTSATLSTEGSFAYIRERLGIEMASELSLGSPYNFSEQALVYVAHDLPEPNQPHYSSQLHRALVELARATHGRMLVLFTSKSQLNVAYRAISHPLAQENIVVLGQYMDGSRAQLIERFRTMERAVLLGTHSFWEGVDVVGPALSCLVITRLPFPVPTDPLQGARSQVYANPFLDYAVPQAVIRFRQGFGRLLRSTTDRGIVAILDSRLDSKSYGSTFLNSLPPVDLRVGPFRDLPPLAARWLGEWEQVV
jgi:predicted DnaQ family exonuclease/DinG family helicase